MSSLLWLIKRRLFFSFLQTDIQAPLNRQIIQSSETVMYLVKMVNNFLDYFSGGSMTKTKGDNDLGTTNNMPRYCTYKKMCTFQCPNL
jgi:hypothetical protein